MSARPARASSCTSDGSCQGESFQSLPICLVISDERWGGRATNSDEVAFKVTMVELPVMTSRSPLARPGFCFARDQAIVACLDRVVAAQTNRRTRLTRSILASGSQ